GQLLSRARREPCTTVANHAPQHSDFADPQSSQRIAIKLLTRFRAEHSPSRRRVTHPPVLPGAADAEKPPEPPGPPAATDSIRESANSTTTTPCLVRTPLEPQRFLCHLHCCPLW